MVPEWLVWISYAMMIWTVGFVLGAGWCGMCTKNKLDHLEELLQAAYKKLDAYCTTCPVNDVKQEIES